MPQTLGFATTKGRNCRDAERQPADSRQFRPAMRPATRPRRFSVTAPPPGPHPGGGDRRNTEANAEAAPRIKSAVCNGNRYQVGFDHGRDCLAAPAHQRKIMVRTATLTLLTCALLMQGCESSNPDSTPAETSATQPATQPASKSAGAAPTPATSESMWIWPERRGEPRDRSADHAECVTLSETQPSANMRIGVLWDCMRQKGWFRDRGADFNFGATGK